MNTYSFRKDLLAVQEELLRFAYKLTADREEANDLLQETSLKALDTKTNLNPTPISEVGCIPLCATSLSIITGK
jgi:DNA-directed RNA polymerase specialized sigma24 family protein